MLALLGAFSVPRTLAATRTAQVIRAFLSAATSDTRGGRRTPRRSELPRQCSIKCDDDCFSRTSVSGSLTL